MSRDGEHESDPLGELLDDQISILESAHAELGIWLPRYTEAIALLRTYRFAHPIALPSFQ